MSAIEQAPAPSADVAARRARWDALDAVHRVFAIERRQAIAAREQAPMLRDSRTYLLLVACPAAVAVPGVLLLAATQRSATAGITALVLAAAAALAFTVLAGQLAASRRDADLPDVIPPTDDTSLIHHNGALGWQPAPRHLQVRHGDDVDNTMTSTTTAVITTALVERVAAAARQQHRQR